MAAIRSPLCLLLVSLCLVALTQGRYISKKSEKELSANAKWLDLLKEVSGDKKISKDRANVRDEDCNEDEYTCEDGKCAEWDGLCDHTCDDFSEFLCSCNKGEQYACVNGDCVDWDTLCVDPCDELAEMICGGKKKSATKYMALMKSIHGKTKKTHAVAKAAIKSDRECDIHMEFECDNGECIDWDDFCSESCKDNSDDYYCEDKSAVKKMITLMTKKTNLNKKTSNSHIRHKDAKGAFKAVKDECDAYDDFVCDDGECISWDDICEDQCDDGSDEEICEDEDDRKKILRLVKATKLNRKGKKAISAKKAVKTTKTDRDCDDSAEYTCDNGKCVEWDELCDEPCDDFIEEFCSDKSSLKKFYKVIKASQKNKHT